MTVTPPRTVPVTAVTVDMVERLLRSGKVDKQLPPRAKPDRRGFLDDFQLGIDHEQSGAGIDRKARTSTAEELEIQLKDPVSRRYNFLFSFAE